MRRAYAVVVRRAARNFSADCPDLPGCVATGRTLDETLRRMRSAIAFHIEGLRLEGQRIPRPRRSLASIVRQRGAGQLYTMLSVTP